MMICQLVRSMLAKTGSWCGVGQDITGYKNWIFLYVLLVVLCHTTFKHISLFVWIVETLLCLNLSCLTTYCHLP